MSKAPLALLLAVVSGVAHAATFTGTVFEDVDYGGGAGRSLAASSAVGLNGVTVELYRASTNAYIASATTNASGFFTLSSGAGNNFQVRVRVVNGSVRSSRAGGAACTIERLVCMAYTSARRGAVTRTSILRRSANSTSTVSP
jgi:hypothetical protein